MAARRKQDLTTNKDTHVFSADVKMSAFQPIDVKPVFGRRWITNGVHNVNFDTYRNAYDDSPTNSSIINAFVNYVYGEGLIDINGENISQYISDSDVLLIVQDYKIYGGFACQVIWSMAKVPLRIEYIPIYKLAVNYDQESIEVNGYWYSWDWKNNFVYRPTFYPKFDGTYKEENLEILVVRRATAEPFFPIPDYLSGIPWAQVEGELANGGKNHFKNALGALTVINYNNGRQATPELARQEAKKVRDNYVGTDNQAKVIVSFNESAESAVVVDQLHPPELNQQNVFYSEEAERKLIVAHSAPPILFAGSNTGSGFSSNADEIAVATKGLYRRHINPMRKVIINGLESIFKLIDAEIKLDFKDFEEETKLENS
jgi:hypothetical protein